MILTLTTHVTVILMLCCFSLDLALAATNKLAPPSLPTGCACPGDSLNYTCTVVGGSSTIWSGTAFDCRGNQISLLHEQFGISAAAGDCGSLSAIGDSVTDTSGQVCYSSTLTVPVSVSLNGLTVGCDREPSVTVSGSPHTLSVAGTAPTGLTVTSIHQSTFTLIWSPTVSCSSVTTYQVNVSGMSCGSCSYNPGTNTSTCSGWTINGQNCSFSVMSVICGGMTGEPSESVDIVLQEPDPPNVSKELKYLQSTGDLSSLSVSFPTVPSVPLGSGLKPPVTYSVQFNNDTREFPESNCGGGVCTGTFTDFPVEDFDFTVVVSNGLGNGRASPSMRVLYNVYIVVSLTMEVIENTTTFTLNLLEGFVGTTDMRVEYRTGGGIVMNATSSSTASAGGSLSLTLTSLQVGANYTYSLFITQNGMMTEIQGTFKNSRCELEDLSSLSNSTMCSTGDFIGGVRTPNGEVCYTGTSPGGGFFADTFCDQGYKLEYAASQRRFCQSDGDWNGTAAQCVPVPPSLTPSACRVGCIVGIVCGVIGVLLIAVFLLGGSIVVYKFKGSSHKSKSRDSEEHGLTESSSHPPPGPDSLYADPNAIEHIITVTGQEYAMVDVEGKKKKQFDGRAIEHQTAPSGAINTEVDKPKREPDVVPPGSGGPNYTVTAIYQNQKSDAQWQSQDPGCVGYSVVTPRERWAS